MTVCKHYIVSQYCSQCRANVEILSLLVKGIREKQLDDSNHSVSEIQLYPSLQKIPDAELFTWRNTVKKLWNKNKLTNCSYVFFAHSIFTEPHVKLSLVPEADVLLFFMFIRHVY